MTDARSLAVAQTVPQPGDLEANLEQHIRLARIAAEARPQVLLFPELSLTGYELNLADDLAFHPSDRRLAPLAHVARTHAMTIIAGAPVRMGPFLFIGAFILSPDRTFACYTKHHLGAFSSADSPDGIVPPPEATVFRPGPSNPLVHFGANTGAIAICADTGRPSHPREAAARGARTYFASMFVIPAHLEKETANLRAYAVLHSMTVTFANFGGPSGGLPSGGRSAIWSEKGELLAELGASGAGLVLAAEDDTGWHAETIGLDGL